MTTTYLSPEHLVAWIVGVADPVIDEGSIVLVDLPEGGAVLPEIHAGIPAVVVGLSHDPDTAPGRAACDVVLLPDDPDRRGVEASVAANPIAAAALAGLLRGADRQGIEDGLMGESAVYSALQGGPEFAAWRAGRPRRERPPEGDPVRVERSGGVLEVTLTRPHVRNALDAAMRDALVEAFRLPALDPSIGEVHLRGEGAAFCSGGDLDEFGTFTDPASAHLLRLRQSVGRAIAAVADRVIAHVHGPCVGSGIELPAFAGRVVADPGATFSLPEVSLGLVPGAGGTVSLPRRIGRHRTARLALSGSPIDATTAQAWGLVDAIVTR